MSHRTCTLLAIAVATSFPLSSRAQTADPAAATTFSDLTLRLPAKSFIVVTDQQGREERGRLVGISSGTVTIEGRVRVAFTEPEVKVVRRKMPDRVIDGGLIGFAIGTLAPLAVCTIRSDSSETVGCAIGSAGFGGLPGFAVGALIDRARGRMVTIFRATAQPRPGTDP